MKRLFQQLGWLLLIGSACDPPNGTPANQRDASDTKAFNALRTSGDSNQPRQFADWIQACSKLPTNRRQEFRAPAKELLPMRTFDDLDGVIDDFFEWAVNGPMRRMEAWLGEKPTKQAFFNTSQLYGESPAIPFQPFAQKLIVPADSEVIVHGDLHGDIQSLNQMLVWLNGQGYLNGFKVAREKVYLLFLGDYTDRGVYGSEVIYTLLRLKVENPDRVWLVRGNHEDIGLTRRYGFLREFIGKFGNNTRNIRKITRIYDFLPVVLYLGTHSDFLQCNHGGMEPGYNPAALLAANAPAQFQFLGPLRQASFIQRHPEALQSLDPLTRNRYKRLLKDSVPESPTTPVLLGFMWNDFSILEDEPALGLDPGRGWIFGSRTTHTILAEGSGANHRMRAVFRAHQHSATLNPMMRRLLASNGVFRHWQHADSAELLNASGQQLRQVLIQTAVRDIPEDSVWTFNVSPDSVYGEGCNYTFDTFGILTIRERFEDWTLKVANQTIAR